MREEQEPRITIEPLDILELLRDSVRKISLWYDRGARARDHVYAFENELRRTRWPDEIAVECDAQRGSLSVCADPRMDGGTQLCFQEKGFVTDWETEDLIAADRILDHLALQIRAETETLLEREA